MTALEQAERRASKIAEILRPLGRGPLSKKHAVVAANLLGVHWTTVYRLRRKFLANPVASAVASRRRGPSKGDHRLETVSKRRVATVNFSLDLLT